MPSIKINTAFNPFDGEAPLQNRNHYLDKFEKDKIIVSVSNSNDLYYRVNDINSYIIPIEAKKKKSNWLMSGLIGFGGGILIMLLK